MYYFFPFASAGSFVADLFSLLLKRIFSILEGLHLLSQKTPGQETV